MGSLSASGVPVVAKDNFTYRKRDIKITATAATNDSVANLVTAPVTRTISSGSICRDDGTVTYTEDLVWSVTRLGRTTTSRVASDASATRSVVVDLNGNETLVNIEDSLAPNVPQVGIRHTGNKVVHGQAVGDTVVERISNSGAL